MKFFFSSLLCTLFSAMAMAQTVTSPNGNVSLTFALDNGKPTYLLTYKGRDVVKKSYLGLELAKDKHASKGKNETDLLDGFSVTSTNTSTFDETWKPVWGETATIRNHYTELQVNLRQKDTERNMKCCICQWTQIYSDSMCVGKV